MYQAHGIGYAEYDRNMDKRIEIEMERDKNYKAGNKLAEQFK